MVFGMKSLSIYTPIKNVKYSIENFRVEQKTDYEKLVFEIITDGSIHPKDAFRSILQGCMPMDTFPFKCNW